VKMSYAPTAHDTNSVFIHLIFLALEFYLY